MEESNDQSPGQEKPAKKTIVGLARTETIVALAAIVVSIMTMFVYIFQARIMVDQQHTSVWPYVEWTATISRDLEDEFYISIVNKGVGPALVKDSKLYLDGSLYTYNEYRDFMAKLLGDSTKRDALWIMYSVVDNRVLAPGEEVKIMHVKSWQGVRIPQFDAARFKFTLCYCNIYKDCWITDGTVSKEGECK